MKQESQQHPPSAIGEAKADFIERIGLVAQNEGLPKSAGRIFGLLVFDGCPHAFGDLANSLQVSRGSVSSSVRLLVERGLIRRVSRQGDRQDYFQLADDPFGSLIEGAQRRAGLARREIEIVLEQLPDEASGPRDRLENYSNFYRSIEVGLGEARNRLSDKD